MKKEPTISKNWLVIGAKNTGKTHRAMSIARTTLKGTRHRRLIVYNHSQNDSYNDPSKRVMYVSERVDIADFLAGDWPEVREFQVEDYLRKRFSEFLELAMQLRNTALVLDDAGAAFHPSCTELEVDFMGTPKNNNCDIFYQMHHFNQAPPKLLLAMDMVVLKETEDNLPLPKKVPYQGIITMLQREIREENDHYPDNQRWAERLVDLKNSRVYTISPNDGTITEIRQFREFLR